MTKRFSISGTPIMGFVNAFDLDFDAVENAYNDLIRERYPEIYDDDDDDQIPCQGRFLGTVRLDHGKVTCDLSTGCGYDETYLHDLGTAKFETKLELLEDNLDSLFGELMGKSEKTSLMIERRHRMPKYPKVWMYKRERKGDKGKRRRKACWIMTKTVFPNVRLEANDDELVATVNPADGVMDWAPFRGPVV